MDIHYVVLLDIFYRINGSRKCSGIYYIVTGKKTAQSLSDSQWFGIEHYYAAFKGMAYSAFMDALDDLLESDMIALKEEHVYIVTNKGEQFISREMERLIFLNHLNGLKYSSIELSSWHLITLYVQVLSNSLYQELNYSAVVRDREAVHKVKSLYPRSEAERKKQADALYNEISRLLSYCDPSSAGIFVKKLSGYKRIGSTFEQSARECRISKTEIVLRFRSVLHLFLQNTAMNKMEYPVLHSLIGSLTDIPALTRSASLTYELLMEEKSLQEIMELRNLKASTLEDHLVEIAREIPTFSIHSFISEKESDDVKNFYLKTQENKLRPFKDEFPHLSYLQIRLVLAKVGGKHATGSSA